MGWREQEFKILQHRITSVVSSSSCYSLKICICFLWNCIPLKFLWIKYWSLHVSHHPDIIWDTGVVGAVGIQLRSMKMWSLSQDLRERFSTAHKSCLSQSQSMEVPSTLLHLYHPSLHPSISITLWWQLYEVLLGIQKKRETLSPVTKKQARQGRFYLSQ